MPKYTATIHVPGYMPMDDEPYLYDTPREAWKDLADRIEQSWDNYPEDENEAILEAHTELHNIDQDQPGGFWAPTPGYEGKHDLGLNYEVNEVIDEDAEKFFA